MDKSQEISEYVKESMKKDSYDKYVEHQKDIYSDKIEKEHDIYNSKIGLEQMPEFNLLLDNIDKLQELYRENANEEEKNRMIAKINNTINIINSRNLWNSDSLKIVQQKLNIAVNSKGQSR